MICSVRKLTTDEGLADFRAGFSAAIFARSRGGQQGDVPLSYLRQCATVRGVFDSQGTLVGGYAVGARSPLRLLDFVPSAPRSALTPPAGASWDDCCEVTCMWRTRALSPSAMNVFVWPRVARDLWATRCTWVLGGDQNMRLDAKYLRMTRAVTLYLGPSSLGLPSRLFAFRRSSVFRGILWVLFAEPALRIGRIFRPSPPRLKDPERAPSVF